MHFCQSADAQISARHVPYLNALEEESTDSLARILVPLAIKAWEDLTSETGQLKFDHDHYLKIWALTRPKLPCDYVLLDEAQDANPVIADIVESQTHAQRILVGDECQAIYGWRGATNAMEKFSGKRLPLAQSFRFGPAIAREANKWLDYLDANLRLRGFDQINSRLGSLDWPAAVLCRTNAGAIHEAIQAHQNHRRAALVGGGEAIKRLAMAAEDLKEGRPTDHPELFMFANWGEVQEFVQEDVAGHDLKVFVKLIDDLGADVVIDACNRLVDERYADVVVSTAHKAKGREWESVRIANDFRQPKEGEDGEREPLPREEAMLAYVAVTRAKLMLDRSGLAWVDTL